MDRAEEYRLVTLAQAGDREAAASLVQQHHWALVKIARGVKSRDMDDADKYQIACFYFLRSLRTFDVTRGFRLSTYTYLFVAKNLRRDAFCNGFFKLHPNARKTDAAAVDRIMDGGVSTLNPDAPAAMDALLRADPATSWLDDAEERATVIAAIARLKKKRWREVMELLMQGLKITEAAAVLGITKQHALFIKNKAVSRLQWELNEVKLTRKPPAV
jgi:RNA polymerase sigma factor (sigma-70 family)